MRKVVASSLVCFAISCNDIPIKSLSSTYTVQIELQKQKANPAKLDVLWVVDDSPSMCEEQQSLARSFGAFLDVFQKFTAIDMRLAVTTTNVCKYQDALVLRDKDNKEIICTSDEQCQQLNSRYVCREIQQGAKRCVNPSWPLCEMDSDCQSRRCKLVIDDGRKHCLQTGAVRGEFIYQPTSEWPPACREKRAVPCLNDEQCQQAGLPDPDKWVCDKRYGASEIFSCDVPPQFESDPKKDMDGYEGDYLYVVNSECIYKCDKENDPAGCARTFGVPSGCLDVCGAGCNEDACISHFSVSDACGSICASPDKCNDVCMGVFKDHSVCAIICSAEDCNGVCRKQAVAPHCGNVCKTDWDCMNFCKTYLHDEASCSQVCGSQTCYQTCLDKFKKQDFLCFLACNGADTCSDRCIAEFGSTYRCHIPGGDPTQAGCMAPVPTAYCPSKDLFFAEDFATNPAKCITRCRILLSRPELGDKDPANNCEIICKGQEMSAQCECAKYADYEERCKCLTERGDDGLPKCGSGVQCSIKDRCESFIPPTITDRSTLSDEEIAERKAECSSISIPVLDSVVADRYYRAYKQGVWPGDPAWAGLDEATTKRLVFEKLFTCMASVGAVQTLCGSQEQGLLAAWMALDKNGENKEQAKVFLRDDAYLLIIVISDEDDCSTAITEGKYLKLINAGRCACEPDTQGCTADGKCGGTPGTLMPTSYLVNYLKSLKEDPAQVVFAAVVGAPIPNSQTSPVDDETKIAERYYECKCDKTKPSLAVNTYVCLSAQGRADLGSRYIAVAQGFGPKFGQVSNICSDEGLRPALENIARLVVPLLNRVCLPRPLNRPCLALCEKEFGDISRCKNLCRMPEEECKTTCMSFFANDEERCDLVCYKEELIEVRVMDKDGNSYTVEYGTEACPSDWDGKDLSVLRFSLDRNAPACEKFDPEKGFSEKNAIKFNCPLDPSVRLEINYMGSPFYRQ